MESKKQFLVTAEEIAQLFHRKKQRANFKDIFIKLFREFLLIIIIFIITFSIINWPAVSQNIQYWWHVEYRNQPGLNPKIDSTNPPKPVESHLSIPRLNVDAPIIWDIAYDQIIPNLQNGVVHYKDTAYPNEVGNAFIVGHSSDYIWSKGKYKNIFALIGKLKAGDKITLTYQDQQYKYEVFDSIIVKPSEIEVLKSTSDPILTLMTCYPIGRTSKRLIIKAKLISPILTQPQTSSPPTINLPRAR